MSRFDAYDRKARLSPGLLAAAPIAIATVSLGLKQLPVVASSSGIVAAAGGSYILAGIVAQAGRNAQSDLYVKWGGRPTTQLLRTRQPGRNVIQRNAWRDAIAQLTGVTLKSEAEEISDPLTADHAIEAATDQIRTLGWKPDRHPAVASELAQYGMERNLFGFRWYGRAIAALCCIGLVVGFFLPDHFARSAIVGGLAIDALLLLSWIVVPSEPRTREASFRYAEQLMNAAVNENRSRPPASPTP